MRLIAIDSVSGREAEIVRFLAGYLSQCGLQVRLFPVAGERRNIYATFDERPARIVFNTHVDTVPPQYGPSEDEGRIYGRGACDTHGILSAQLEALLHLHGQGVPGLGLLLLVGEETGHDGAIHAGGCSEIAEPEVLIVGEPTENRLMTSQMGRLKANVEAYGVAGHSGYPQVFDSAVDKLLMFLCALRRADWVKSDSNEGTTVNVRLNETAAADNQIAAHAAARLMFRCAEPCAVIRQRLEALVAAVSSKLGSPKTQNPHFEVVWDKAQNDPIDSLSTLPGFATGTAAFNTDIAYLGWKRCRTFLLGPGSILNAHRIAEGGDPASGEWISKQEQIDGVRLYIRLVQTLVG